MVKDGLRQLCWDHAKINIMNWPEPNALIDKLSLLVMGIYSIIFKFELPEFLHHLMNGLSLVYLIGSFTQQYNNI